jgi:hypothetical protein
VKFDPAICFAFIKSFLSELRHAAFAKREAFFAPVNPQTGVDRNI